MFVAFHWGPRAGENPPWVMGFELPRRCETWARWMCRCFLSLSLPLGVDEAGEENGECPFLDLPGLAPAVQTWLSTPDMSVEKL